MKDGEITLTAACAKYKLEPHKLLAACRRNEWTDPMAVDHDDDHDDFVLLDNWQLHNYAKSQRPLRVKFFDWLKSFKSDDQPGR